MFLLAGYAGACWCGRLAGYSRAASALERTAFLFSPYQLFCCELCLFGGPNLRRGPPAPVLAGTLHCARFPGALTWACRAVLGRADVDASHHPPLGPAFFCDIFPAGQAGPAPVRAWPALAAYGLAGFAAPGFLAPILALRRFSAALRSGGPGITRHSATLPILWRLRPSGDRSLDQSLQGRRLGFLSGRIVGADPCPRQGQGPGLRPGRIQCRLFLAWSPALDFWPYWSLAGPSFTNRLLGLPPLSAACCAASGPAAAPLASCSRRWPGYHIVFYHILSAAEPERLIFREQGEVLPPEGLYFVLPGDFNLESAAAQIFSMTAKNNCAPGAEERPLSRGGRVRSPGCARPGFFFSNCPGPGPGSQGLPQAAPFFAGSFYPSMYEIKRTASPGRHPTVQRSRGLSGTWDYCWNTGSGACPGRTGECARVLVLCGLILSGIFRRGTGPCVGMP